MKISPAILTDSVEEFKRQVNDYSQFTDLVDIDIDLKGDSFPGKVTLNTEKVIENIQNIKINFCIHLMVENPNLEILKFRNLKNNNLIFLVHQEFWNDSLLDLDEYKNNKLGIVIKAESGLKGIDFYNKFPEVQLMTIETGQQGNPFKPEVLDRAEWLKGAGYKGLVRIDGGVNLKTVEFIKHHLIDIVSVGSFFSKSKNPKLDYMKLELALNMVSQE